MIENFARKVVVNDNESFRWFQKVLRDKGVIAALKRKGYRMAIRSASKTKN
jgi:hypothetical protein